MNTNNLHELINRYESNYALFNDSEHNEVFKWRAVQQFRSVWFSDNKPEDFSSLFKEAKKECSNMIDNAQVSPTNGIVKLAEEYPDEVERLFREVLFAPDDGDIDLKQKHLDTFLDEIEKLRQKAFPRFYKYKQDRHAASCYMTFIDPEHNYIYRYSEAEEFAKNIEFGMDIGAGEDFKLKNYYVLCDMIVEAMKEHSTLIEKYHELIYSGDFYPDESLHLLAFDFMYCCRCYNLFNGLTHISKKESIKSYKLEQLREQEAAERQKKIEELEKEIRDLELSIEPYKDISLINVEVNHKNYGDGIIVKQNVNQITIRFAEVEKVFMIHKKFAMRPTFENDAEVVEAFTVYADTMDKIESLNRQLEMLYADKEKSMRAMQELNSEILGEVLNISNKGDGLNNE